VKITKRQLRRIIKEERHALLKEARTANPRGPFSPMRSRAHPEFAAMIKEARPVSTGAWASVAEAAEPKTTDEWVDHLGQIIDQDMTSRGLTSYREEGAAVIAALEILRREIKDEMSGPTR